MRTTVDCLPCFMSQAVRGAKSSVPGDAAVHEAVAKECAAFLATADLGRNPPDLAGDLFARIARITGDPDPFLRDKQAANERVMELMPGLAAMVAAERASGDPLRTALNLAIIGNFMDVGVARIFDWERALAEEAGLCLGEAFAAFRAELSPGARVLVLGDNAGEIGLDTLLVKELQGLGCDVAYAVRGGPVLNDATMDDAEFVGMTGICRVLESGAATPGTPVARISPELRAGLDAAEVVLAKGQGNFESLYAERPDVYFAFKAKCNVVAEPLGVDVGTSVFMHA